MAKKKKDAAQAPPDPRQVFDDALERAATLGRSVASLTDQVDVLTAERDDLAEIVATRAAVSELGKNGNLVLPFKPLASGERIPREYGLSKPRVEFRVSGPRQRALVAIARGLIAGGASVTTSLPGGRKSVVLVTDVVLAVKWLIDHVELVG